MSDRNVDQSERADHVVRSIVVTGLAMAPFLIAVRARVTGMTFDSLLVPHISIPRAVVAAYYDLALVAGLTALALAAVWILSRNGQRVRSVSRIYLGIAVFVLTAAMVNVIAVEMLRRPFTYQWLYYSDFLQSRASALAASSMLTLQTVSVFATIMFAFILLRTALAFVADRYRPRLFRRKVKATAVMAVLFYFVAAGYYLSSRAMWRPGTLENPIIAFALSISANHVPVIFTIEPEFGPSDFLEARARGTAQTRRPGAPKPASSNVLVVILESAGAPYYSFYGGTYGIDKRLQRRRGDMRVFDGIYSHAPATNKAMISVLCSAYPLISFQTLTREHPTLPLGCLSSELKRHGYRTGYFGSSDLRFQRAQDFLAARSFDVVEGLRERTCELPIIANSTEEWPHADASDDACTAASAADWIEEDPDIPFFAILWTAMAHFPYHAHEPEVDFGVGDAFFNRYLNALTYADEVLDEVLNRLDAAGMAESTLVVIVGDHGEAFGHHGYYVHSSIYEETARVPFILLQPGRFHGEKDDTVGGLIDLAPTVVDLLGLPIHDDWQGRSLFDADRSGRAYFFSPWSDYMFGFREGPLKYMLNATTGEYKMFDVAADPGEHNNLLLQRSGKERYIDHRLAAWVQHQADLWERRTSPAHSDHASRGN
jgi:lipoteichoic acid synthase